MTHYHPLLQMNICQKREKSILFSVKDNGIGISSKHLEKIFTIFQRLTQMTKYEGTGIGLVIAQKIVHQQVEKSGLNQNSEPSSTFYFTIPKGKIN